MKRRIIALLLLTALFFCAVGCGKNRAASPLLWKVTDEAGHTLYLFGTMHVGDERSKTVLEKVSPILDGCDALAVEFDVVAYQNDPASSIDSLLPFLLTDGTTIGDHMPADLYERACKLLDDAGLYPSMMQNYNLAMWGQLVESAAIETKSDLGTESAMDVLLINRAYETGLPVLDIESAAFQMTLLNSFDDELYLAQIQTTLDNLDRYGMSLEMMYRAWLSGNRDVFWNIVAQQPAADGSDLYADYNARLITARNANMAQAAKACLSGGKTVFFAVGAAHMANETGIVQLLTDAGYTVEEVKYSDNN